MKNAFIQIEISEESKDIISFAIEGRGKFRFTRLPFGLANSLSCFQEARDEFIRGLPIDLPSVSLE